MSAYIEDVQDPTVSFTVGFATYDGSTIVLSYDQYDLTVPSLHNHVRAYEARIVTDPPHANGYHLI